MDFTLLSDLIHDQRETFLERAPGIRREVAWQAHVDHPQVVAITGVRRCGKSTLLRQIGEGLDGEFHYLNLEDERLVEFVLQDFSQALLVFEKMAPYRVLLLDEIQNVEGWERFVRRAQDDGWKIYLTGSNSRLLSRELGTHLTGRYQRLELLPFSFRELLALRGIDPGRRSTKGKAEIMAAFDAYLRGGGFPEYLVYGLTTFLNGVYEDVIYRDIVARFSIREVKTFQLVAHYLFSNFTGDLSYNGVKKALGIASATTVRDYVGYLEQAYLGFELGKYSYSLKEQSRSKKFYVIDNGVRNQVAFRFSADLGKALENLVHLELRRRYGNSLYFLRPNRDKSECDFLVVEGGNPSQVIQVCYELTDRNRTREHAGLKAAMAQFPDARGLLLTYNQTELLSLDGQPATVLPVWRWLIE